MASEQEMLSNDPLSDEDLIRRGLIGYEPEPGQEYSPALQAAFKPPEDDPEVEAAMHAPADFKAAMVRKYAQPAPADDTPTGLDKPSAFMASLLAKYAAPQPTGMGDVRAADAASGLDQAPPAPLAKANPSDVVSASPDELLNPSPEPGAAPRMPVAHKDPTPGMGDVRAADAASGLDQPPPEPSAPPLAQADLSDPSAPAMDPEAFPEPGAAPQVQGRAPAPMPRPSLNNQDKVSEALYHATNRTPLPNTFFEPKPAPASQDPDILALRKALLAKQLAAEPKKPMVKPEDDQTSDVADAKRKMLINTRKDDVAKFGGGDLDTGIALIGRLSPKEMDKVFNIQDANSKMSMAKDRAAALADRTAKHLAIADEMMNVRLGKAVPVGTRQAVKLGADIDALVDEMGGPDKVKGVGAVEGAFPDALVGSKIMQLRHDARVLRQAGLSGAFGARLTTWETQQWDAAYGVIDGAHTLDQVMMGIHNMRAMAMWKADQAVNGFNQERVNKMVGQMTGPGVFPQPPPVRGSGASTLPERPPNKALSWAGDAAKAGGGVINYLTGGAAPQQPDAPAAPPKVGDRKQGKSGKYFVFSASGQWEREGK